MDKDVREIRAALESMAYWLACFVFAFIVGVVAVASSIIISLDNIRATTQCIGVEDRAFQQCYQEAER